LGNVENSKLSAPLERLPKTLVSARVMGSMSVAGLPVATTSGKSTGSIITRTDPVEGIRWANFGKPFDTCQ
jgi:hypothetical protein